MVRFALLLALLLPVAARGEASSYIESMTSPEVREAIAAGKTTVLVPIGGTEQNGAHMVLGKHNVRARVMAGRIAAKLGNALVAPTIAYVPEGSVTPPAAHMRYAGTISIPADAFEKMLVGAARSFRQHGFRDIVFLSDHGGYLRNVTAVVARLNGEWRDGETRAHAPAEYYQAATTDFAKQLAAEGFAPAQIGVHAGLADTALALAVDPSLVREPLMAAGPSPGVEGDPRRASREIGERGAALIVDKTAAAITKSIGASRGRR